MPPLSPRRKTCGTGFGNAILNAKGQLRTRKGRKFQEASGLHVADFLGGDPERKALQSCIDQDDLDTYLSTSLLLQDRFVEDRRPKILDVQVVREDSKRTPNKDVASVSVPIPKRPIRVCPVEQLIIEAAIRDGVASLERDGGVVPDDFDLSQSDNPNLLPWELTRQELFSLENDSFLAWRRNLADMEESLGAVMTPYEKNLEFWRQLWRVVERSDLIVLILDGRNPLFYRSPDLEAFAKTVDPLKEVVLLVNKSDFVPRETRRRWVDYFTHQKISIKFFSALRELKLAELFEDPCGSAGHGDLTREPTLGEPADVMSATDLRRWLVERRQVHLERKRVRVLLARRIVHANPDWAWYSPRTAQKASELPTVEATTFDEAANVDDAQSVDGVLKVQSKFDALMSESEDSQVSADSDFSSGDGETDKLETESEDTESEDTAEESVAEVDTAKEVHFDETVVSSGRSPPPLVDADGFQVGMVGFPNVGKSSAINALLAGRSLNLVAATSKTPGKTKHLQTLRLCITPEEDPNWASTGYLTDPIVLCDCPGLVFPLMTATRAHLVINNIVILEHFQGDICECVQLICDRCPDKLVERYRLCPRSFPIMKAREFLTALAVARRYFSGGRGQVPDVFRAGKMVLGDFISGRLVCIEESPGSPERERPVEMDKTIARYSDCIEDETLREVVPKVLQPRKLTKRAMRMDDKRVQRGQKLVGW